MTYPQKNGRYTTNCRECPLRKCGAFQDFSAQTLAFMQRFKVGELKIEAGHQFLMEGQNSPQLFTALSGLGLRYKSLENGDRQVVNFIFPGDFIGLQAGVLGEMKHSVEATTEMTLCVFDRKDIWQVYKSEPERAFSLTWLAAVEEHLLGEALVAVGQRPGLERIAWALLRAYRRLSKLGLRTGRSVPFPFLQRDVADALGLSLVHTNKTLASLRTRQLASWSDGRLTIADEDQLAKISGSLSDEEEDWKRPLM